MLIKLNIDERQRQTKHHSEGTTIPVTNHHQTLDHQTLLLLVIVMDAVRRRLPMSSSANVVGGQNVVPILGWRYKSGKGHRAWIKGF